MSNQYEIKEYSSKFATKMNYVLDILNVSPLQHGRAKAIELITNEKDTTIKNWLFNSKYPRENKRLTVADAIGVSHNYLFNDSIDIQNILKPEIFHETQCYLIPFIGEKEVFDFKENKIFPIKSRIPIMFPGFDLIVNKYGTNIYVTKINDGVFEPHVQQNSDIIYSENVIFEDYRLVLHYEPKSNKLIVKKVIEEMGNLYLEFFNNKNQLIKEPLRINDKYVSILLTFTR